MTSKSFLRWAGSKQKLLPVLKKYWGEGYNRYLEPFMGSAQLFFDIAPAKAILSDSNLDLIEAFHQVQKNPYPVYEILRQWPISKKNYYKIRAINPEGLGK